MRQLTLTISDNELEMLNKIANQKKKTIQAIIHEQLEKLLLTDDPIYRLGQFPVISGVPDASVNHDRYLYEGK